jgi:hypothetical protein
MMVWIILSSLSAISACIMQWLPDDLKFAKVLNGFAISLFGIEFIVAGAVKDVFYDDPDHDSFSRLGLIACGSFFAVVGVISMIFAITKNSPKNQGVSLEKKSKKD